MSEVSGIVILVGVFTLVVFMLNGFPGQKEECIASGDHWVIGQMGNYICSPASSHHCDMYGDWYENCEKPRIEECKQDPSKWFCSREVKE